MNPIFMQLAAVIVSYRIAAPPNSVVRYAGEQYDTGPSGSIELVADPASTTITLGETTFNLPQSGPTDEFGSATVSLLPESIGSKVELKKKSTRARAAR